MEFNGIHRLEMFAKSNREWVLIAAIVMIGSVFRFVLLERQSIWGDEACMVYLTQDTPRAILHALMAEDRPDVDVAPPLYFLLVHSWQDAFGTSIRAFRAFSAVWGIIAVLSGILLARKLSDFPTACIVGLLIAFSPFQIWYSQEIRMYSMATALAALSLLGISGCLIHRRHWGFMSLSVLSMSALLLTQYYGFLLLGAVSAFLVFHSIVKKTSRTDIRWLSLIIVLPVLIFIPWVSTLLLDFSQANHPGGFPSYFHPIKSLVLLFIKFTLFGNEAFIKDHAVLIGLTSLLFFVLVVRGLKRLTGFRLLIGAVVILPIITVFSAGLFEFNVYKSHPFIIFHIPFLMIVALGITSFPTRYVWKLVAMVIGINLIVLSTLNFRGNYVKPRVREIAQWIHTHQNPGDLVAVIPAFLPNPSPIVGDLLAYRYYSGSDNEVRYLTGDDASDILNTLISNFPEERKLFLVYQRNPSVSAAIETIRIEMSRRYHHVQYLDFPSRFRDFSMGLDVFESKVTVSSNQTGASE